MSVQPLHRPSINRDTMRSSATRTTVTKNTSVSLPVPHHRTSKMKQARSTFGSNFPHRAYHSKQDKAALSLPPLAWGRHDVQVEENFWKQAQGKLASVYHQSSDDLTMIHTLSGDST